MAHFHDLDEDVLPRILAHCDIYTILSVSRVTLPRRHPSHLLTAAQLQVSKFLRALTLSRQLWHSLLLDLAARSLLHIPDREKLKAYSTAELIMEVKRLISGPATWSDESSTAPTLAGSTSFNNCRVNSSPADIRLLPGGRFFVVHHGQGVKCWDATTGDGIWTYPARVTDYSVEMLDEGRSAIFFFLVYHVNQ